MNTDPNVNPRGVPSTTTARFSFSLGRLPVPSTTLNTSPISTPIGPRPPEILLDATAATVETLGHPFSQKSIRVTWTAEVGGTPFSPLAHTADDGATLHKGSSTQQQILVVNLPTPLFCRCCQEDAALLAVLHGSTPYEHRAENTKWKWVAESLGTGRNGKQCRDRYVNYLRGGIKKGPWTPEEESLLVDLYHVFGSRWSSMSKILKVRSDNDIKNKWNAMMRKQERLQNQMRNRPLWEFLSESRPTSAPFAAPTSKTNIVLPPRFSPLSTRKLGRYDGPIMDSSAAQLKSPPPASDLLPGGNPIEGGPPTPTSRKPTDPTECPLVLSSTITEH